MMDEHKSKILIIEDSKLTVKMIRNRLQQEEDALVETAASFEEVKQVLANHPTRFFVAVVDINLPDAPDGEVVDYVISKGIPPIILTGNFREDVRAMMMEKAVVDYVVKRDHQELDYLVSVIKRVRDNVNHKVLVVDDSSVCRLILSRYLKRQNLKVIQAESAEDGLLKLASHPDICLVITDQNMVGMTGSDMIVKIRAIYPRDELAIIGVSASNQKSLSALFLKSGANDFFAKPFSYEELFCRVTQNIDAVTLQQQLAQSHAIDPLTKTYTEKHLMQVGNTLHENLRRGNFIYAIALLSIVEYKKLKEAHGAMVADAALKFVGKRFMSQSRQSDVIARVSGGEFCILCSGVNAESAQAYIARLEKSIKEHFFSCGDDTYQVTIRSAISDPRADSFVACFNEVRQKMLGTDSLDKTA